MHRHQPHPITTPTTTFSDHLLSKQGKRRGSYNCGRCGQPKKGHVCHILDTPSDSASPSVTDDLRVNVNTDVITPSPLSTVRSVRTMQRERSKKSDICLNVTPSDFASPSVTFGINVTCSDVVTPSDFVSPSVTFGVGAGGVDVTSSDVVTSSDFASPSVTFGVGAGGVNVAYEVLTPCSPLRTVRTMQRTVRQEKQSAVVDGVNVCSEVATPSPLRTVRTMQRTVRREKKSAVVDGANVNVTSHIITHSPLHTVRGTRTVQRTSNLRRALSFDEDIDVRESDEDPGGDDEEEFIDDEVEIGSGTLPVSCLWEVMRRLPPPALLAAAKVCTGWRDVSKRIWKAAEEVRIRVPVRIQVGCVGSVLQKCCSLVRLSLTMESDMDSTMLACIAFACPNLVSLEILTCEGSFNRITGDELGRFVADKRCLTTLKMEGCSNLGAFVLCSTTLSTLWLSDLHSLSKMVFNLPNLNEISLDFSRQENDSTDLTSMMDGLGRSCPKLRNIHIASLHLSHSVVLSLTAAHLRGLRMLSLVLGSEITDASVVAISKCYSNLELLDLSGSSISDSGLGMICNVFPETLTRLLVALCPNITSSGIQFATAQLPLLELMDCGMTICEENSDPELQTSPNSKRHLTYQKLFIKHDRLKKLSLWGCSSLDSLYLSCPNLSDLNLNSCKNLIPEKLVLQCPKVESVHAIGCKDVLIQAVETQVSSDYAPLEDRYSRKRMADGSKRVGIPFSFTQQLPDCDESNWKVRKRRCTVRVN